MTIGVTGDYVLPAGDVISSIDETVLTVTGSLWHSVTLNGRVQASTVSFPYPLIGVRVFGDASGAPRTLTIGPEGSITILTEAPQGYAAALSSGSGIKVVNLGAITVRSQGESGGVSVGDAGFENAGTITVSSPGSATGVHMNGGGKFTNTGTITVTGGSSQFHGATAVRIYNHGSGPDDYLNSGTISAVHVAGASVSVGMQVAGYTALVNSGLIEGDRALVLVRNDNLIDGVGNHVITNTGALRGTVFLNNFTGEQVILRNSGVIQGEVTLNGGADIYDGASGTVSGAVHGGDGADFLLGGWGAETLSGDAGNDSIDGGAAGADLLDGGDGVDTLSFAGSAVGIGLNVAAQTATGGVAFSNFERYFGSNLADTMLGSASTDTLSGIGGADTINGGQGDDLIAGGEGQSYLRGDEGNDSVVGGTGFDDINGNMGDDTVAGGAGDDWVVGGKDNDLLFGESGGDIVYGNLGNDTQDGGEGADIVRGGQGDDVVQGGADNDFVSGDRGSDTLTGGAGADTFHTFSEAGIDRVTDFSRAEGDRVQLLPGATWTVRQVGADTVIETGPGAQLILVGVHASSLTGDWIFGA